ncbi:M15 family metallopeptidase [Sediminibacillus massiliensis]|uniref:M15 family metallopeptidase n=1 Tax=Sediminibacillus massiliensis TaxID=1926277 RepID=UPI00098859C9|nr:M15 family metallopeptidase [Sediminibacillus massiliensis]
MKGLSLVRLTIFIWLIIISSIVLFVVLYLDNEHINEGNKQIEEDAEMPDGLHPEVEAKRDELLQRAEEKGIEVIITEGFRTLERQDELYEQGRTTEGDIVTYAQGGESYHNYGLAIDFALINQDGNITWNTSYDGNNNEKSDWVEVAEIGKDLGFEWGGDWNRFKDYPHLQMDFGLSIHELQNGKRPDIDE